MIHILEQHEPLGRPDLILFDFDGTISKLRTGWDEVMYELFLDSIPGEQDEVATLSKAYIDESTGIPTIRQMKWLAEQIARRGGRALEPWQYKKEYTDRLRETIEKRKREIEQGIQPAEHYLVPGSMPFLEALKREDIPLIVASGTDEADVRSEAETLGVLDYFTEIVGADPYADMCAKEDTMRRIIRPGLKMLVVGDGKVEIQLGREVGALTLGVASWDDFGNMSDSPNPIKAQRLATAGAHALMANFSDFTDIRAWI